MANTSIPSSKYYYKKTDISTEVESPKAYFTSGRFWSSDFKFNGDNIVAALTPSNNPIPEIITFDTFYDKKNSSSLKFPKVGCMPTFESTKIYDYTASGSNLVNYVKFNVSENSISIYHQVYNGPKEEEKTYYKSNFYKGVLPEYVLIELQAAGGGGSRGWWRATVLVVPGGSAGGSGGGSGAYGLAIIPVAELNNTSIYVGGPGAGRTGDYSVGGGNAVESYVSIGSTRIMTLNGGGGGGAPHDETSGNGGAGGTVGRVDSKYVRYTHPGASGGQGQSEKRGSKPPVDSDGYTFNADNVTPYGISSDESRKWGPPARGSATSRGSIKFRGGDGAPYTDTDHRNEQGGGGGGGSAFSAGEGGMGTSTVDYIPPRAGDGAGGSGGSSSSCGGDGGFARVRIYAGYSV